MSIHHDFWFWLGPQWDLVILFTCFWSVSFLFCIMHVKPSPFLSNALLFIFSFLVVDVFSVNLSWLYYVLCETLPFWFWDTSGIRMLLAQSSRFFFFNSPMIGGSNIYSEMATTGSRTQALVLFVLYHSCCFIDVCLQGCKVASTVFSYSKSRKVMLGFSWLGISF